MFSYSTADGPPSHNTYGVKTEATDNMDKNGQGMVYIKSIGNVRQTELSE